MATERIGIGMDPSSQRKSPERPEQKAEQLREEISRTRSALSEDVKALGERLNPEQLKEDAKEVVHHAADVAREGAKNMVRDAKDAAFGSLRHAKDHAFESISVSVDNINQRARMAGHDVSDFVATHALPLALLGAGTGWLLISMSHQRRLAATYPTGRFGYEEESTWERARDRAGDITERARERAGDITNRAGSALSHTGQRISERAQALSAGMGDRAAQLRSQITDGAHYLGHEASELGHRAYDGIERAGTRAREVSERNPLAVGLFALAAGVTVAMLLPATRRENQLLGRTRDRLIDTAQQKAEELKSTVQRSASDVREVIDEIRSPGSTHA